MGLGAFRGLAGWLERRIVARIAAEAARVGARARVERIRVSLVPPLRLGGVVVEKPGQWEARLDEVSVAPRAWGRSGLGAFARVSIGNATLSLPAGLELHVNPAVWEVSPQWAAELLAPTRGLSLSASATSSGGRYELKASQLEVGRLVQLVREGEPSPDLGVVDGEAHGAGSLGRSFAVSWRFAAIGAESTGKAIVTRGPAATRAWSSR